MQIWVDADACPAVIRDILFRAADRARMRTTLVANQPVRRAVSPYIHFVQVPAGMNVADARIVELMEPRDLVITADVPLAALVIEKGGVALDPRGTLYTSENVRERAASLEKLMRGRTAPLQRKALILNSDCCPPTSVPLAQRARTTSFFVQLWTWWQCGQVTFWVFTLAFAQSCSSMVWPVGVSLAVEGHLTSRRLITGPVFSLGAAVDVKNFILVGIQYELYQCHRGTSPILRDRRW